MEPNTQLYVLCCQLAGELFLRKVRTVVGKVGGMPPDSNLTIYMGFTQKYESHQIAQKDIKGRA